jgi:diacylglycerol kinase (CTP)
MDITEITLTMDMEFKKRTEMHWARKLWHMSGVTAIAIGYYYMPIFWARVTLLLLWLLFVPFDFWRLRSPFLNDIATHLFRPIMRESEAKDLAGTTYLLSGVLLVSLIFPREIVLITLLYLAFADPMASVIGIKYGKDKIFGHKSLQGSVAAFVICTVVTLAVLFYKGLMLDRIVIVSLLGGLIGALAEAVPVGRLDDNFSIPVISALGLWLLFMAFGGFASGLSILGAV